MVRDVNTRDREALAYTITHSPRPKYPDGTASDPVPSTLTNKVPSTTMWKLCDPLQIECRWTVYVPAGRPAKNTGMVAGTDGCASADGEEGAGLGDDVELADPAGEGVAAVPPAGDRAGAAAAGRLQAAAPATKEQATTATIVRMTAKLR